jgi:hypothetical protein
VVRSSSPATASPIAAQRPPPARSRSTGRQAPVRRRCRDRRKRRSALVAQGDGLERVDREEDRAEDEPARERAAVRKSAAAPGDRGEDHERGDKPLGEKDEHADLGDGALDHREGHPPEEGSDQEKQRGGGSGHRRRFGGSECPRNNGRASAAAS